MDRSGAPEMNAGLLSPIDPAKLPQDPSDFRPLSGTIGERVGALPVGHKRNGAVSLSPTKTLPHAECHPPSPQLGAPSGDCQQRCAKIVSKIRIILF